MKISNPTTFAFVCFLVQAAAVSAKKGFTSPPEHGPDSATMERIKTAANFDAQGVRMEICPTGDCLNGKYMRLSVASLTELDVNGSAVESVDKFKPKNSDWTDIKTTEVGGVNISSTTFVSTVEVGAGKKEVQFNLTASIYQGDATVPYGSKTFAVSAGALKFTVDIAGWPFSTTANNLVLAVSLDAKGANNKALGTPQMKPKGKSGPDIETVDMGDSMFMDVPSLVILNGGVEANLVDMSVVESAGDTSFEWVFPSFTTSLHYDPVLGEHSTVTTSSSTTSGSADGSDWSDWGSDFDGDFNGDSNSDLGDIFDSSNSLDTTTSSRSSTSGGVVANSGTRSSSSNTPTSSSTASSTASSGRGSKTGASASKDNGETEAPTLIKTTSSACTVSLSGLGVGMLMAAITYSLL